MTRCDRFVATLTLTTVLLAAAGCGSTAPGDVSSEHGPPWVTLSDDKFSSTSSGGALDADGKARRDENGNFVLRFSGTNTEFSSVLEDISSRYEVSIVVRPKELAARGITIEVTGADARAVLEDLARQCKLDLEDLGDKKWRLSLPGSENAEEQAITIKDE
jgi:hypothetical protein